MGTAGTPGRSGRTMTMSGTDRGRGVMRWIIPPLRKRRWHPGDVRLLRRFSNADAAICKRWSASVRGRSGKHRLIAGVAAGLGTLAWLYIVGFGPPNGDGIAGPLFAWMERRFGSYTWFDPVQIFGAIVLWFAPTAIWMSICDQRLLHKRVRRDISYALRRPLCLSCGYDCAGIPADAGYVTCPECGEQTPYVSDLASSTASEDLG